MTNVSFRALTRPDFPLLVTWFAEPHVNEWYGPPVDLATIDAKYGPRIVGDTSTEVFVIEESAAPIGLIQRYRASDHPEWAHAIGVAVDPATAGGIDYLIGDPMLIGRGLGSDAIAAFAPLVFARYPEIDMIVAAPQRANVGSWRALERAGFRRIWEGLLDSSDESDKGPSYLLALHRPS